MKFLIEVPDEAVEPLIKRAITRGLLRENPDRSWTKKERREFVKFGLVYLLDEERTKS